MEIIKLSENSIRCVISTEELEERGLELDDLVTDHNKAESFLRDIMEEARQEFDFQLHGSQLNVQVMMLPEGEVALTISDDSQMSVRQMLSMLRDKIKELQSSVDNAKETAAETERNLKATRENLKERLKTPLWTECASLDDCMLLARQLSGGSEIPSSLYKYRDTYFISMDFSQLYNEVSLDVLVMSEYADAIWTQDTTCALIMEHGDRILKENAIATLAEL